jgi:hypothetical protein
MLKRNRPELNSSSSSSSSLLSSSSSSSSSSSDVSSSAKRPRILSEEQENQYLDMVSESKLLVKSMNSKLVTAQQHAYIKKEEQEAAKTVAQAMAARLVTMQQMVKKAECAAEQAAVALADLEKRVEKVGIEHAFLCQTQPHSNISNWQQCAFDVKLYVSNLVLSSYTLFASSSAKMKENVLADIIDGYQDVGKAREEVKHVEQWIDNRDYLYSPFVLVLIGKGLITVDADLLATPSELIGCVFEPNVIRALQKGFVTSKEIVHYLNRCEQDTFAMLEHAVLFSDLFEKGFSLLESSRISLKSYFESSNPKQYLQDQWNTSIPSTQELEDARYEIYGNRFA